MKVLAILLLCTIPCCLIQGNPLNNPGRSHRKFRGLDEQEYKDMEAVVREIKKMTNRRHRQPERDTGDSLLGDIALTLEQACQYYEDMDSQSTNPSIAALCKKHTREKRKILDFNRYVGKWTGTINYVIDSSMSTQGVTSTENAVAHWERYTCLDFQRQPTSYNNKHIRVISGGGCWSYIARTGSTEQQLSLGNGCTSYPGISIHEFGHAIGSFHEMSRPDRDTYVYVDYSQIDPGWTSNFNLASESNTYNTPYDYGSVMHYGGDSAQCGSCSGNTIVSKAPYSQQSLGNRVKATFLDHLAVNRAYDCQSKGACRDNTLQCANGGLPDYRSDCTTCLCPEGLGGDLCDQPATQTSGCTPSASELTATSTEQCLESPNYPSYSYESTCSWMIKSSDGSPVKIRFTGTFNLFAYTYTGSSGYRCQNYVEVKNSTNLQLRGMRFCTNTIPVFPNDGYLDTVNDEILIHFSSETVLTSGTRYGGVFKMCYKTDAVDLCSSGPCSNGGDCTVVDQTTFSCDCTDTGFSGDTCQTDIDECGSSPCQNSGVCTNGVNEYTCNCDATDFIGTECQTARICTTTPCSNGGSCQSSNDIDFTCDCSGTGFTGSTCGSDLNECASSPCTNGASCNNEVNSYSCSCDTGYSGTNCEQGSCALSPCAQGTCTDGGALGYTCACDAGYEGQNCDTVMNPCDATPCSNGGSCSSDGDGINFTCDCSGTGYSGDTCQTVTGCSSSPCRNRGTCINGANGSYTCNCRKRFTGSECQTRIRGKGR